MLHSHLARRPVCSLSAQNALLIAPPSTKDGARVADTSGLATWPRSELGAVQSALRIADE